MPQLDKLTYSTQIFWLLVCFTSFYLIILKKVLPSILLNLKTRETTINSILEINKDSSMEIREVTNSFIKTNRDASDKLEVFIQETSNQVNQKLNFVPSIAVSRLNNEEVYNDTIELVSTKKLAIM